jgi:hypothetical protein
MHCDELGVVDSIQGIDTDGLLVCSHEHPT